MRYILSFIILCLLSVPAAMALTDNDAAKIEQAMKAYKEKDTQTAIKILKPLAEKGNAAAQSSLGSVYGWDNEAEALRWFKLAAKQGDVHARVNMGDMYMGGYGGLKQDYKEAMKQYTMAADMGDTDAQISMGLMYQYGNGVPQDINEAIRLYKKASEKNITAYTYLGDMYRMGNGVKQDMDEAVRYYTMAAERGDKYQQKNLGDIYSGGNMLYGDKYKDTAKAMKWYMAAAKSGNGDAQANMGAMYYNGKLMPKDMMVAYVWYTISLNTNSTNSVVADIVSKMESGMSDADKAKAKAKINELSKEINPVPDKDNSWRPFSL